MVHVPVVAGLPELVVATLVVLPAVVAFIYTLLCVLESNASGSIRIACNSKIPELYTHRSYLDKHL